VSATDYQSGREALGARLRELRAEAGLQGKELADLQAWAQALGVPAEGADLLSRLRGLESRHRSWRRQLATGHRAVQDRYVAAYRRTATVRGYEATVIPGLFQTPDYARHLLLLNADLMRSPRDTDEAVRARMRRQEVLYENGHSFRVLIWEGALHAHVGPGEVMAGQHDRLIGLIGMPQVSLGIVPFGARLRLSPKHGFWIFDEERVVVETINSEFVLEAADELALYGRVWDRLSETAVGGEQARRLIGRARASLGLG
jgi:hypothetical protein